MSHLFTVLLLKPDYQADVFGHDTHLSFVSVDEDDPEQACLTAQMEAMVQGGAEPARSSDERMDADIHDDPSDYHPLFVCRGHVPNLI